MKTLTPGAYVIMDPSFTVVEGEVLYDTETTVDDAARLLPLTDLRPAFDASTHVLSCTGYTVGADVVTKNYSVVDKPEPTPAEVWRQKLAGRITVGTTGIEIEASEAVRNLLTGQLTMLSIALSLGKIQPSTPQDIWDADGVKHTMPTSDIIGFMLTYGAQWAQMFEEFAP